MKDCLFCKIASKEIATEVILENEYFMAFNDINPKARIHVLIIPKEHSRDISEIDSKNISNLPVFVKTLAEKLGVDDDGYRIITNKGKAAGQIIFHAHFHMLAGQDLGDLI